MSKSIIYFALGLAAGLILGLFLGYSVQPDPMLREVRYKVLMVAKANADKDLAVMVYEPKGVVFSDSLKTGSSDNFELIRHARVGDAVTLEATNYSTGENAYEMVLCSILSNGVEIVKSHSQLDSHPTATCRGIVR